MVAASSRRSMCVPTSRNGVLGQCWVISGTYCGGGGSGVRKHDGTIIMYTLTIVYVQLRTKREQNVLFLLSNSRAHLESVTTPR